MPTPRGWPKNVRKKAVAAAIAEYRRLSPFATGDLPSTPRSPCGGWRLGLLPRSYGKSRRANCGSHLTHRLREQDSNPRSPAEIEDCASRERGLSVGTSATRSGVEPTGVRSNSNPYLAALPRAIRCGLGGIRQHPRSGGTLDHRSTKSLSLASVALARRAT